jgi:hypothetical protein
MICLLRSAQHAPQMPGAGTSARTARVCTLREGNEGLCLGWTVSKLLNHETGKIRTYLDLQDSWVEDMPVMSSPKTGTTPRSASQVLSERYRACVEWPYHTKAQVFSSPSQSKASAGSISEL